MGACAAKQLVRARLNLDQLPLKIMGVRRERQGSEARSPGLRSSGTGKEGTTTGDIVMGRH